MITLVAAKSENGIIGVNGRMPWHCPVDMKVFRAATLGNTVIMGRKTFEEIGFGGLANRFNIVVSSSESNRRTLMERIGVDKPNVVVVSSFHAAVNFYETTPVTGRLGKLCVIGGERIYQEAVNSGLASQAILSTMVGLHITNNNDDDVESSVARFPQLSTDLWELSRDTVVEDPTALLVEGVTVDDQLWLDSQPWRVKIEVWTKRSSNSQQ